MSAAPDECEEIDSRAEVDTERLRTMLDANLDFVWRSLRRLGLLDHEADDATQRVFVVASQRLDRIQLGAERAFLFQTALRVASSSRRSIARRREVLSEAPPESEDGAPRPDELVDQHRARELLDRVMGALDLDLRVVFSLYEIEELSIPEIAETLGIPRGTVASRLRRAREDFKSTLARWTARGGRGVR